MKSLKLLIVLSVLFSACKKDGPALTPEPDPITPVATDTSSQLAKILVSFKAIVNSQTLIPVSKYYPNTSNEYFTVTKFNYYISNVRLKKADGTWYTEPNSYHLIRHLDQQTSFDMANFPPGEYTDISFLIGVDSLRNVSGAQSGALDPVHQMFWDWNTGYIFLKLEGFFSSPTVSEGEYAIHVGGFEAPFSCLQSLTLPLPQNLNAVKKGEHQIAFKVAIDEIFKNPKQIGFDKYYEEVVKGPKVFQDLSINYRDIFSIEKVN